MFGDKQVIDHVDGTETLGGTTHRTYADRVARLASALVAATVCGRVIGLERLPGICHRHLELYLAVPLAGAVLYTINLRLEPDEMTSIVDHADDTMIFADRRWNTCWPP